MSAIRRIKKELTDIAEDTKDHQNMVYSVSPDENNIFLWKGFVFGPVGSPYQNGVFQITIDFPANYPFKPPKVYFNTKVYHPNISMSGAICLDILKDKWSPALSISKLLLSIISLLTDPNPNDPLAPDVARVYRTNRSLFDQTARSWTYQFAQLG